MSLARALARLVHNGPANLPNMRPSRGFHYFGTPEFGDVHGSQFGPWQYIYQMPADLKVLDALGDTTGRGNEFMARAAQRAFPNDAEFAALLRRGDDPQAQDDFYEIFMDRSHPWWGEEFDRAGIDALQYGEEYLLRPQAIERLPLLRAYRHNNGPDEPF